MLIEGVEAILLVSPNARELSDFYKKTLGLPLEEEEHEGVPLHYGCEIGSTHFAIHPADGWPGEHTKNAQSPVIGFKTADALAATKSLRDFGIEAADPFDHGFALVVAFRDPDGNHIELLETR